MPTTTASASDGLPAGPVRPYSPSWRADGLNKTLASRLQQRDLLAKLPAWPWSAGTLRGFVTAILLPLRLFLMRRAVAQFVYRRDPGTEAGAMVRCRAA